MEKNGTSGMNGKMASDQPKRRACDECRGRKLACSKEADGCARCKREGIKCIYSPQKRMGRPRKQRPVEAAEPQRAVAEPAAAPPIEGARPIVFPDIKFDSTIGMDLDLSFLDVNNMDMNFLEIVDPNSQFPLPPAQTGPSHGTAEYGKPLHAMGTTNGFWPVSGLADINFDDPDPSSMPPPAEEITREDIAQILSVDLAETVPSLSPPSTSSPSTHASPESDSSQPCHCLSALYLALESLRTLPKGVADAMRVARTATRTAHDTILCAACGDPPLDQNAIPIQSIQSMMMLGALLPSLSNAYMRILKMVDAEAAAADADRRKIRFTLSGYGGLWGWMARNDWDRCNAAERLEGAILEPVLWRLTARALLKIDVYGINDTTPGVDADEGARQPGLKDIISLMEKRQRRRHEQMDALIAAGLVSKPTCHHVPLSSTSDRPTCMRIIDIAKRSMDDLVIP